MYVCVVIPYNSKKDCQSCSWSAEQGKMNFISPCLRSRPRIWSRETGSAVPSRVSLLFLHNQAESSIWCFHGGIPPDSAAAFIHLFEPPYAIGSVPSSSGHVFAYRWRSLPRVRRHRASSPQGSSRNGRCLCSYRHGPTDMRLFFLHPLY